MRNKLEMIQDYKKLDGLIKQKLTLDHAIRALGKEVNEKYELVDPGHSPSGDTVRATLRGEIQELLLAEALLNETNN